MQYGQPMMVYPQQQLPSFPQPAQTQPRPQAYANLPSPPKPKPANVLPPPDLREKPKLEIPAPEQLGIRLDNTAPPAVVVPDPEKLGIKLD